MKVDILLFATLKELAGKNRLTIELPGPIASVQDVKDQLSKDFPLMGKNLSVAIAALNEEYAFEEDEVRDGDSLAFFPPVSGGSDTYPTIAQLASEPINHDELVASITVPATGAVVVFSGMVRGETRQEGGGKLMTEHLEYEAYESMAVAKMYQVADEIREKYPLVQGIAIIQRIGKLEVGQNTIVIACSAGHRGDGCFEGVKYGIDRLKEIVPVWKKEVGVDGESWVEGSYMPNPQDRQNS